MAVSVGIPVLQTDDVVLEDPSRRISGNELLDRITRLANSLRDDLGLRPRDHMAMVVGNRVEFIELVLGAMCAGVWITPINWHLSTDEIGYILGDSDAKVLFVDPGVVDLEVIDSVVGESLGWHLPSGSAVRLGEEYEALIASAYDRPIDAGGPAGSTMPYTSGTTGRPKGVKRVVEQRLGDQLGALVAGGRRIGLDGVGTHLVAGPLYHAAPGGFALRDLLSGARLVIMPRWDAATALRLISELGVTHTHMVPTMFTRMLRLCDETREAFDPSSLTTVLHGAAPVSIGLKQAMIEWWGPVLVEYWGASECGVVTLIDSLEWLEHPGTVGRPTAGLEVWAADESRCRLPAGETGLLWIHSPRLDEVFNYHNDREKTEASRLEPGTYTLGDIGYVDTDGFVFLTDRASEMIISGGVNIYPAEVENVLGEHPAIADVAVFGVPDDEWGESVKAAVELVPEVEPTPELSDAITDFARARLAGFKVPRLLEFVEDVPRAPSGKLLRRKLRDSSRQKTRPDIGDVGG